MSPFLPATFLFTALLLLVPYPREASAEPVKDCPDLKNPVPLGKLDPLKSEVILKNLKFFKTESRPMTTAPDRIGIFNVKGHKGLSGTLGIALFKGDSQIAGVLPEYKEPNPKSLRDAVAWGKTRYVFENKRDGDVATYTAFDDRYIPSSKGKMHATNHGRVKIKEGQLTYVGIMVPLVTDEGALGLSPERFAGVHYTFCLESAELETSGT